MNARSSKKLNRQTKPKAVKRTASKRSAVKGRTLAVRIGPVQREVLKAFVEAQIDALWAPDRPKQTATEVVNGVLEYVSFLPPRLQTGFGIGLRLINAYSRRKLGVGFANVTPYSRRRQLLNQGELDDSSLPESQRLDRITWEEKPILHTAVSSIAMLVRLVTVSLQPARKLVNLTWPLDCQNPTNLPDPIPKPSYADLSEEFDVCVVGSGAGGSTVAAWLARQGKSVVVIEEGDWVDPREMVLKEDGKLWPPVDYKALARVYRYANGNVSGRLLSDSQYSDSWMSYRAQQPGQMVNFMQAKVVGGGPTVNNAIHLDISEEVWNRWPARPGGISYQTLSDRMRVVKLQSGVGKYAAEHRSGDRTAIFRFGTERANISGEWLPIGFADDAYGGGTENVVCPFSHKRDGVHKPIPGKPTSFLMEALLASNNRVQLAYKTRASRLRLNASGSTVQYLEAKDDHGPTARTVRIRAKQFVVCGGPIWTTKLLFDSDIYVAGLGHGLSANIGTPVYAVFSTTLSIDSQVRPDPGIAQCYFVREDRNHGEPALENVFAVPGSWSVGLSGWFDEYARAIRAYERMASCLMVVPTLAHGRVESDGRPDLSINANEFGQILRGIRRIANIYFAAARDSGQSVELFLATKSVFLDPKTSYPLRIQDMQQLNVALDHVERLGPAFLTLATSHPQGGTNGT